MLFQLSVYIVYHSSIEIFYFYDYIPHSTNFCVECLLLYCDNYDALRFCFTIFALALFSSFLLLTVLNMTCFVRLRF